MQTSSADFSGLTSDSLGTGLFDLKSTGLLRSDFSLALSQPTIALDLSSNDLTSQAIQRTNLSIRSLKQELGQKGKPGVRHKEIDTGAGVLSSTTGDGTPDALLNGGIVRRKESSHQGGGNLNEPGETIATARKIALTKQTHKLTEEVGKSDRVDFYRFDLLTSSSFNLRIKEDSKQINTVLLDAAGQVVTEPLYRQGGELGQINRSLVAGTYYLKVTGKGDASSYQMSVSKEPGGRLGNAQLLPITATPRIWKDSVGKGDRSDMYRFDLTGNNTFSLNLKGLKANADMALLDSSGKVMQISRRFGKQDESIGATLEAGTYYAKVIGRGRDTDYRLDMAAVPPVKDPRRFLTGDAAKTSGVFTVGSSGEVSFDYLLDGSSLQGELAIFNLKGMDRFEVGSKRYVQEAALRALSNSADSGYVVILDQTEGARFTASAGEPNFNAGEYKGTKTFTMNPGDKFGVMLIPNGTTPDVLLNSDFNGDRRPLFSIPAANLESAIQLAQVVDVVADGNSFAFEDQSLTGNSDFDYDDLVFQVRGATGQTTPLNNVIDTAKDWRNTNIGQQVATYAATNKFSPLSKIGSKLAEAFVEYETHLRNGGNSSNFKPRSSLLQVQDGKIGIDVIASGDPKALLVDLQTLGLERSATFQDIVSGWLPIEALNKASTLRNLRFAEPAYKSEPDVGVTDTQGDRAINANTVRAATFDGNGVAVGVISDSYDIVASDLTNAADDIASNDLPGATNTNGFANPINVGPGNAWDGSGIDEGRAMLQIIHDVAPGANLLFHTDTGTTAGYAQAILALANAGADVIVDDIRQLDEPMFQDGPIAQAVDTVVDRGVAYFASAGNYGNKSYENAFNPGSTFADNAFDPMFEGGVAHDFDLGTGIDHFQQITLPAVPVGGGSINYRFIFQWDEPFAFNGASGSSNDMDIYLFDNNLANPTLLALSADNNVEIAGNGRNPLEILEFGRLAGSPQAQFNLMIVRSQTTTGSNPGLMKYVIRQNVNGVTIDEHNSATRSTGYGHSSAVGAQAVGAAYFGQTPNFGTNPPVKEDFSSIGSIQILFDKAGSRLPTPQNRLKPEIVAPDGVNTTFFGNDVNDDLDDGIFGNADNDTFPNFFGTSAAAPHAAAVAALMLNAVPGSSPFNIYKALQETAIDMGTSGVDNETGYGLIQADQAIARLRGLETPIVSITVPDPTASESSDPALFDPGQFIVTRTSTPSTINRDLIVNYTFAGTATNGSDYVESGSNDLPPVAIDGTILIPAGSTTATLPITAVDDTDFEPNETLDVTLSDNSTYNVDDAQRQATITIVSNDKLIRRLTVSGDIFALDAEDVGDDEPGSLPYNETTTLTQTEFQNVLNRQLSVGDEIRVELLLNGRVVDDFGNVKIEGFAKLFENDDSSDDELEDEEAINILVPRGQIVSIMINLVNETATKDDFARINLVLDNVLDG